MNVTKLTRTDRSEYACMLREMAKQVDSGMISCATVVAFDCDGKAHEFILPYDEKISSRQA